MDYWYWGPAIKNTIRTPGGFWQAWRYQWWTSVTSRAFALSSSPLAELRYGAFFFSFLVILLVLRLAQLSRKKLLFGQPLGFAIQPFEYMVQAAINRKNFHRKLL